MKNINIGQTVNTLANVGVIAGIIFLILEIQQANRIARVSAEYDLRNNFSSVNELVLVNDELAEFLFRRSEDGAVLDSTARVRAGAWTRRSLNVWLAAESAYENGIATEVTYNNIFDDIRFEIENSGPSMRAVWRDTLNVYPSLSDTAVFMYITELLEEHSDTE